MRLIIPRDSRYENTFATVDFDIHKLELCNSLTVLNAIRSAVTEWVRTSDAGKDLWKVSSHDLNIGDLAVIGPEIHDEELTALLHNEGISRLRIETYIGDNPVHPSWTFDTHLVNDWMLKKNPV